MSKELPYFKFEPNQWENGNIQMCSRELKGLFIDLCALYWSRLGELPYALALQKHCNGNDGALQDLKKLEIIGVVDGQIIIEFLDEQLNEFQETSDKRRAAANKRWSNASAMQVQSKSNAIREEKRREKNTNTDEKNKINSKVFYDNEINTNENTDIYRSFVNDLHDNEYAVEFLKLKTQVTFKNFNNLLKESKLKNKRLSKEIESMLEWGANKPKFYKDKSNAYLTLLSWIKRG